MRRRMMAVGLPAACAVGSISAVTVGWASRTRGSARGPTRASGRTQTIDPPKNTLAVFSPAFTSVDEITAVASEPVRAFTRTEDDALNDLWRYSATRSTWTRLTHFAARGSRWSVIRTPVI